MPNTRETLRALVSAFNVNNYDFNAVKTNFKLQSEGKKDYIVVSFDKSMDTYQCSEYLDSIKRKIIREFYGIEESNDAEILDTAKLIFDVNSFPFDISNRDWSWDKQHGFKFVTPVDEGVIFNLKSHLAASLAKDVIEGMPTCNIRASDRKGYLWRGEFDNKGLRKKFEREFLSRMRERYENVPKDPLKVEGNSVYIKDVFDDARFVDSITRRAAWRIGRDLQADSKSRSDVRAFKNLIMEFINQPEGLIANGFVCAPPLNGKGASILIPVILDSKGFRALTNKEALSINSTFDGAVFVDITGKTQAELPVNGSSGIYGINFYDLQVSHCVITKIIESSVINKDHELAIDPELYLQALSPAQSPFNSPTHAEPPRTPPNPRKRNRDSGIGESPPKPEDSVAPSPSGGPSSYFTESLSPTQEFPTRDQNVVLKDSPRRESEKFPVLLPVNQLDVPGTSREFLPRSHLNFTTVNYGVSGPSSLSQSVGAAQNRWLPQGTSENKWQPLQFTEPGPSACAQQTNPWSSPAPSAEPSLWQPSRPLSWQGASERRTSDKPLTEEEENLFKALLYVFNYSNNNFDLPDTNFIVKNGKIVSLINDDVDVKEYLKEVRGETIKEYCVNEEEAYDLNEFPFKSLSNCEKNQETTVVANISRGALFNLKKFFILWYGGKMEEIDTNIVKEAVKSGKHRLVELKEKGIEREAGYRARIKRREAVIASYPDEGALEDIPIGKYEAGYRLCRTFNDWETESFAKQYCAEGTSVAGKVKPEDNKDSGISSEEATDAENVSSKAEATTSGYESMDCENTRGGSPKRKPEKPLEGSPEKSLRRDSSPLSRLESLSLSSSSHQIGKC